LDDHILPPTEAEFVYDENNLSLSSSKLRASHSVKLPLLSPSPTSVSEYSWEWGAFPTPSPVKSTFGKGGRLDGGIPRKGKAKQMIDSLRTDALSESVALCASGKLTTKDGDDKAFVLTIDQSSISFELSLALSSTSDVKVERNDREERKNLLSLPHGCDGISISEGFEEGKITFSRFMQDDDVIMNPMLVVKWIHGQYLTRYDDPVLFDTLAIWRVSTLCSRPESTEYQRIAPFEIQV
jgi:phosphatidate phosphatase LPIN